MSYNYLFKNASVDELKSMPEKDLWIEYSKGNNKAGDCIVSLYAKYILKVASTIYHQCNEMYDLDSIVSEGLTALAVKMGEYVKQGINYPFINFAHRRIKGAMYDYVRSERHHGAVLVSMNDDCGDDNDGFTYEDALTDYQDPLKQALFAELEETAINIANSLEYPLNYVVYRHCNGDTFAEIGKKIGEPKSNIQYYWNKALNIIKSKMKDA